MEKNHTGLNWLIAAGIVGADIGTSIFYSTGLLFPIVGYLAPLCIVFVCLMMWALKATYEEGLALSPYNGGAYSMILRTVGRQGAVVAGALTFITYLATAAVSALSGSFYMSSLVGMSSSQVVLYSFIPIILFGILNSRGIKEPAKLVTGIAIFHFALLIIMSIWGLGYLATHDIDWEKMMNITPSGELTVAMVFHGIAAAFLGISGFESAAQIVEELESPIHKTVRSLYKAVVILVSLTAPAISFLCLAILSENEINNNLQSLLSVFAGKLGGSGLATVVVVDATLTLFAAVNTAFVGFIGLATTMAKQGNLPQILLTRLSHKFPSIQGYPFIAIPFMFIAMTMSALVMGEVDIIAKVYEMAFLGVMVSFCIGVVLMRNRPLRRDTPMQYLSKTVIKTEKHVYPLVPLISGIILAIANVLLILHSPSRATNMLIEFVSIVMLIMAYYRWGTLEKRLENRSDLRLGLGKFSTHTDLSDDLPKFVLCTGGTNARRLINVGIRYCLKEMSDQPFELVVFHAEPERDQNGFTSELLQRVVSQQIAPIYRQDFILSVKTLPGDFLEGLILLKKNIPFANLLIGSGRNDRDTKELTAELEKELEIKVHSLGVRG